MKIQCILKDHQAPFVTSVGDDDYAFERDDKGRIVVEVEKERHILSFLARTDAYREVKDEAPPVTTAQNSVGTGKEPAAFDPETASRSELLAFLSAQKAPFRVSMKTDELRAVARMVLSAPEPGPAAAYATPATEDAA